MGSGTKQILVPLQPRPLTVMAKRLGTGTHQTSFSAVRTTRIEKALEQCLTQSAPPEQCRGEGYPNASHQLCDVTLGTFT